MILNEIFNKDKFNFNDIKINHNSLFSSYRGEIDGNEVHVMISDSSDGVEFDGEPVHLKTIVFRVNGETNQIENKKHIQIFSMVMQCIRDYITKEKVDFIVFSSRNEEETRTKLYQRMTQSFGPSMKFSKTDVSVLKKNNLISEDTLEDMDEQNYTNFILVNNEFKSKHKEIFQ